jgi:ankyrin repeat protein
MRIGNPQQNAARALVAFGAALLAVAGFAASLGSTALIDAVKNHDPDAVKALLAQHADVNAAEADGTTALHYAAHAGDSTMVAKLIEAAANAKAANRYGATPLSEAAAVRGSGALIEMLLQAGADANTLTTAEGETVLMTAARNGNAAGVRVLLAHQADPNAKEQYRGQTALMWAAAEGHADIIQMLLGAGADAKIRSGDRDTTLPKLSSGSPVAPIPRGGLTALHFAARNGEMEAARTLLDGGADIDAADSDGNTALVLAILNTHYELARFLIEKGADVNIANKDGRAALYTAIEMHDADWSPRPARKELDQVTSLDVIQNLLAQGADVNARLKSASTIEKFAQDHGDKNLSAGATPFMRAARSGDVTLMRILLDHGADPKLANKDGLTALMAAAGVGWAEKVKGTEAEALEAVRLCADLGLDVKAVNEKGETALHGAALRGGDSIVKFLLEKGGDLNARTKTGFTPLDFANGKGGPPGVTRNPHPATAEMIQQLGGRPGQEVKAEVKQPAGESKAKSDSE